MNMRAFYLVFLFFLLGSLNGFSQKRILVQPSEVIGSRKMRILSTNQGAIEASNVVPAHIINFLATNKHFQVVDRKNITYIQTERELQKSEDFIDGYMVEQGQIEGADYIFRIVFIEDEKTLSLQVFEVSSGLLVCSRDQPVKISSFGIRQLDPLLRNLLYEIMYDCFDMKYSFVRSLAEKNKSVQRALIAIGKTNQAKEEDVVEFYQLETEEVDGENYVRRKVIAKGEILKVEDNNFSEVKITQGHVELYRQMNGPSKIYVIIKNELI